METPDPPPSGAQRPPPRTGRAILAALAAAVCMKLFLFDFMIAEGHSMTPAIEPGTLLLVLKTAYGLRLPGAQTYLIRWTLPRLGDVVVFLSPQGTTAVKRCGGFEGEGFIALGDNSRDSLDSRSYGPVPLDHIVGKVLGIR